MKQKFTYLKSIFKLSCALTFALGAFNVNAQTTTVLTEDFATATAGTNANITNSETVYTNANALVKTAWRCYQAGGAIRLGNSTTNDNSNNGYIQTQSTLDLSANGGNFTVSFDVKGWTTVENDITVAVSGYATQIVSYTATVSDQWQHITLNYTGGKTKRSVTIGTTKRRAFIDNIVISSTVGQTNLAAPVINDPINLETTTFTALWQPVSGATSYIFDLGTDANFSAFLPGYHGVEVTGTSINVTGATGQTSYFCRVYANNTTQLSVHNMLSLNTACMNTPTIAPQSFCTGSGATVANLTATSTGASTIVYAVQEGGEALATDLPLETKSYYVRQVLDGCESSWKKFDVTIVTVAVPEVTSATQTFCATAPHTVAGLNATALDGATLKWYPDATTTNVLDTTTELKSGSYFVSQKVNDCESERKEVVVTVLSTDKPAGLETQTFCSTTAPTVASLAATALDTATLQWYADATSTDVLAPTTALKTGSYYVTQKLNDCESERKEVAVTVLTVTKPAGVDKQEFTDGQTLADIEVIANENLVWYSDAELTKVLPLTTVLADNTTYYAVEKNGDCTSEAFAVTVNKVLATDNFDAVSFKFYPNPVSNVVNITYSKSISAVVVYNLVGQAVLSVTPNAPNVQINMSALSSGCYMATIMAGNQSKTIKLIKQ